ncbi:MAG: nucleotidyltransferase family protein [Sterolibacteriaceae bacterium]|nr:nucleotidyltransferase family protein [Sterolibacteriaceae bacterium]
MAVMTAKISPEAELLSLVARSRIDDAAAGRISALLAHGLDWDQLVRTCIHHRVTPIVSRMLSQNCSVEIPGWVINELNSRCVAIARRNLYLTAKLLQLIQWLNGAGIRAIAYKGPVGAVLAYGSISMRQFGDLDILVESADYMRTRASLGASGYSLTTEWGWECTLVNESESICVDLHRNLAPDQFPVHLDFESLWLRRMSLPIAGGRIDTLSAEDTLVALCIQLIKDAWGESALRLSKVCDIAELIRARSNIDLSRVVETARTLGCLRILQVGIRVAERLFGLGTTEVSWAGQFDRRLDPLVEHVIARLFESSDDRDSSRMPMAAFHFRIRERWRDKLYPYARAAALRLTPNERDRAMVRLPASLFFLYYFVRPVRLAKERLRRLVNW